MDKLIEIVPNVDDLLSLPVEELGGLVLELGSRIRPNGAFTLGDLIGPCFPFAGQSYPPAKRTSVVLVIAEAASWLESNGLIVRDPTQPSGDNWYMKTRRATAMKSKADVSAYARERALPSYLLQPLLLERVSPAFFRHEFDVAVFQAFKLVEVSVREKANAKGANYPPELVGTKLMRQAFDANSGPLTDPNLPSAERYGRADLFAGSIALGKNPTSHRDVNISRDEGMRLIVLASYLLDIVEREG
ncbi:MAG TPA: TIGR02391 family protein [Beijerinckiaceae bacterium]|jgi:hypothetical protein|nr:TIGR02391 family protein [Beijerinckiaceae bacterium]